MKSPPGVLHLSTFRLPEGCEVSGDSTDDLGQRAERKDGDWKDHHPAIMGYPHKLESLQYVYIYNNNKNNNNNNPDISVHDLGCVLG